MKYIFSYLAMLCPFFLFAQNSTYTLSEPYKEIPEIQTDKKWYFSDESKEKVLSVKFDRGLLYLQLFDALNMKEIKREQVSGLPKKYRLSKVDQIQGRIFVFYTVWNKKEKSYQLFAHEVDIEKCQLKSQPQKLLVVDEEVSLSYLYSSNRNNLLVYYKKRPQNNRDAINHNIIGLHVFNQNLDLLAGKEVEIPYTEERVDELTYCIDNDGVPYILVMNHMESRWDVIYGLELLKFNLNNGQAQIIKIKHEVIDKCATYYCGKHHLYEGADKHIHLVGLYNYNEKTKATKNGISSIKIDKEGEVIDRKLYPISTTILNQGEDPKIQKQNNSKKLPCQYLNLREISIQADNSILYTIEQLYILNEGVGAQLSGYHNVYLIKTDPKGEFDWIEKMHIKKVGGEIKEGLADRSIVVDQKHYLFFRGNVKTMEPDLQESYGTDLNRSGLFLTTYRINDETGAVDKCILFDIKDAKGYNLEQFDVNRIVPLLDNEFIMEFQVKGKKDILVKFKIKD